MCDGKNQKKQKPSAEDTMQILSPSSDRRCEIFPPRIEQAPETHTGLHRGKSMKTVVELKERNRVTIPLPMVQGLGLQVGDLIEITIEIVKRAKEAK